MPVRSSSVEDHHSTGMYTEKLPCPPMSIEPVANIHLSYIHMRFSYVKLHLLANGEDLLTLHPLVVPASTVYSPAASPDRSSSVEPSAPNNSLHHRYLKPLH